MRLFHNTSFFIDLVAKTFNDITFKAFLLISVILLTAGASLFWILNMGRPDYDNHGEVNSIFFTKPPHRFIDSFIFTYITSMGEYSTDNFDYGED